MTTYQKLNAADGSAQKGVTVRYTAKTCANPGDGFGAAASPIVMMAARC